MTATIDEVAEAIIDGLDIVHSAGEDAAEATAEKIVKMTADSTADKDRIDKLEAWARKRGCGWMLDRGKPVLKHWSQEPEFTTLREAVDAMDDVRAEFPEEEEG